MNKLVLWVLATAIPVALVAQEIKHNSNGSYYRKCSSFSISRPIRDLVAEHRAKTAALNPEGIRQAPDSERYERLKGNVKKHAAAALIIDAARQSREGTIQATAPFLNMDGQQSTGGYVPLDPNGMIGANYYVQTVNVNYAVYDKNGNIQLAATNFNYLFPGGGNAGDPVTIYDKFADRWLITEIGNTFDTFNIAVSTTNDPTGSFYIYKFCPEVHDFDDYPKYAVWADGYYQTCNCLGTDIVTVYDRTRMLAGDSNAGFISIPWYNSPWEESIDSNSHGTGDGEFFCPMMLNADGQLPPYGSPDYLFYFNDDNWGPPFTDAIIINKVSVDWTTQSGTVTTDDTLPVAAFNSYFTGPGGRQDISQPSDPRSLDVLNGFISYRIPYLRWPHYNTALMCYPVNMDTANLVAGIRWYELHQDINTNKWSVYQQSTFAPNDRISRWNPSIAMDQNGNIGLAYSVSDSSKVYPGCRYTGRRACDSLNTMTIAEVSACSGDTDAFTDNRWGDYSVMNIDAADGVSFWCTNMYAHAGYGSHSNIGTRIFAFNLPGGCGTNTGSVSQSPGLTAYQNGSTLIINGTGIDPYQSVQVDIFDAVGKHITGQALEASSNGIVELSYSVASLSRGIYLVRMGTDNFQRVVKVPVM